MVGQRPPAGKLLALVNDRNSRAAHHGCGLSRDVTTKSVRSLPQLEQRNRSSVVSVWSAPPSLTPTDVPNCRA